MRASRPKSNSQIINGPGAEISGVDFNVSYLTEAFDGELSFMFGGTYQMKWETGGIDVAGKYSAFNPDTPIQTGSYPEWKINGLVGWSRGNHDIRGVMHWTSA